MPVGSVSGEPVLKFADKFCCCKHPGARGRRTRKLNRDCLSFQKILPSTNTGVVNMSELFNLLTV